MTRIIHLDPNFAVAGQLTVADFKELAAQGFKSIISNRPDGEQWGQLSADKVRELAAAAGLTFRHIPLQMPDVLSPETAATTQDALDNLPGPVLAFCKSGTRSAIAWANAARRDQAADTVISALQRAGFNIPGLADELRNRD